jgi:alkanesulfonate monooxygenase
MHPYTAAKMVTARVHARRVWPTCLAGGFENDLVALGDETPHDERYERTTDYTRVMLELLAGRSAAFDGAYYSVKALRLERPLPERLQPGVKYPKPPDEQDPSAELEGFGVRVTRIARNTAEEAWSVAYERSSEDGWVRSRADWP